MIVGDYKGGEVEMDSVHLFRMTAGVVLLPLLWIGDTVSVLGTAEQFSFVPGISEEGGIGSGIFAVLMAAIVLLALVGGTWVVTGGGIPLIGGGDDTRTEPTTPTPKPNQTVTPTPGLDTTPTTSATPTTSSPERTEFSDLERFKATIRTRLEYTMDNDTLTGVSPLALHYRETNKGTNELWLVFRQCDNVEGTRSQLVNTGNVYANAVGDFEERQADRLVVYGVNKLETYNDSITEIPTPLAASAYNGTIRPASYTENWTKDLRNPSGPESEIAFRMTVNESGRSKAERAFHEHYPLEESDRGCPGVAESGDSDDESGAGQRVSSSGVTSAAEPIRP